MKKIHLQRVSDEVNSSAGDMDLPFQEDSSECFLVCNKAAAVITNDRVCEL
jgi:hypothetical protein